MHFPSSLSKIFEKRKNKERLLVSDWAQSIRLAKVSDKSTFCGTMVGHHDGYKAALREGLSQRIDTFGDNDLAEGLEALATSEWLFPTKKVPFSKRDLSGGLHNLQELIFSRSSLALV